MGFQNEIKPKRSLGQNFFVNKSLAENIIDTLFEDSPKHIVEIGPGTGSFTSLIYERNKALTLIEKDFNLYSDLKSKYHDIEIYNEDFLDFNCENLGYDITFFGSLPYNVSKPIIKKIISSDYFTNPAYFIIQKEVADKYCNTDRNQLGLIREIYADYKIIKHIKPDSFKPRPKVTSSFVKFIPHDRYKDIDYKDLEKLILQAFNQPRKTIKNNLKNSKYSLPLEYENLRPNQLTIDQYILIMQSS